MPRASTKRLTDAPEATPEHAAAVVASIEQAAPTPALAPQSVRTPAAPKTIKPVNVVQDGKGAFRLVKVGDHQAEYQFDPNAVASSIPLPLGSDRQGICIMLATKHGLDKAAFLDFCHANTSLVRACGRRYTTGQQLGTVNSAAAVLK